MALDSWEHLQRVMLGLTFLHTRDDIEQFLHRLPGDELEGKRVGGGRWPVSRYDPTDPLYDWLVVDTFAKGYSIALSSGFLKRKIYGYINPR